MKSYNFNICKYNITITIDKKSYEVASPKIVTEQYTSTINDPLPEIKMEEPERLCFMEAAEKYIEAKRGELAPSTIKGYENIIDNHLNGLRLIWLDRLTEKHIQNVFDEEITKGLSVKTLKGYKTFILKVLAEYRPDFHPNIRVTKEGVNETA